jgi:hypothetical protein
MGLIPTAATARGHLWLRSMCTRLEGNASGGHSVYLWRCVFLSPIRIQDVGNGVAGGGSTL